MQKKLTILFAFAIFVLVVGMHTDSYAIHKKNPKAGHGGGGSEVPESATLSLGGIEGKTMFAMDIPVDVGQNSSKRIRFVNPDFAGPIKLQFDVSNCEPVDDSVFGPTDLEDFKDELGGVDTDYDNVRDEFKVINSAFIEVKIDKRNLEDSILVIEYQGSLGGNGTRIMFPKGFVGTYEVSLVDSSNPITFTFTDTVYLRQLTPGGAQNDPLLGCDGQFVVGMLDLGS